MINHDRPETSLPPVHPVAPGSLQPATSVRRLVLALSCSVSFILYLQRYAWGFIKKDVRDEFGWNAEQLGWLDGLFGISYGLGQIPAGMFCDWFGVHLFLSSIILLWSLTLAGFALATSLTWMGAARVVFGFTQAGCYPALGKASKNWFPLATRTSAQGLIATFFGRGGGAASFFLFGTVLSGWLGIPWRWSVGIFALLGILVAAAFLLLFRNTPREHPWANEEEELLIAADDPSAAHAARSRVDWAILARSRTMQFLLLRSFASNLADVMFVNWVPLYLRTEKGLDSLAAGWLAALPLIGGALGGLASGMMQSYIIRRTGSRRWARRGIGLTGKLMAAILVLCCLEVEGALAVSCLFLAVKFFADWEQPAEWGAISDISGRSAATIFACVNAAGSIGNFAAGPLVGKTLTVFSGGDTITTAGWNAVFVVLAIEYVIASSSWLVINSERPLKAEPSSTT